MTTINVPIDEVRALARELRTWTGWLRDDLEEAREAFADLAGTGGDTERVLAATNVTDLVIGGSLDHGIEAMQSHADGLEAFVEAVMAADNLSTGWATVSEDQLDGAHSVAPYAPFSTPFGLVRQVAGVHEVQGPDGRWYPLVTSAEACVSPDAGLPALAALARSAQRGAPYPLTDLRGTTEGLGFVPDDRTWADRAAEGLAIAAGTPPFELFDAAPASTYGDVQFPVGDGNAYHGDEPNPAFASDDTDWEPGDALPDTDRLLDHRSPTFRGEAAAEVAANVARGLWAVLDEDMGAYAWQASFGVDANGAEVAVIRIYQENNVGMGATGTVVDFDENGRPEVDFRPPT